jgi:membrane-bound serine protease (ClpP class)
MLMRGCVILLAFLLGVHSVVLAQISSSAPAASASSAAAAVILVEGEINDYQYGFITRQFAAAREAGATSVILEIDSYGGLVTSGLEISRFLKQQDDLKVIAYVTEKAISAGVMTAMACDEITMAPGTMLGDSAPIMVSPEGGLQTLGATERAKAESPVLADFLDSAERNHHDLLLAEAMVRIGPALYLVENDDHQRRIVASDEYDRLTKEEPQWKTPEGVHNPIRPKDTLLTITDQTAAKIGLSAGTFPTIDQLTAQRNLRIVANLRPSAGDRLIALLSTQGARSLVFFVLLISGYMAFKTPGTGFAEAIAAVALVVLLGVPLMTGYAQWYEIIMVLVGIALIAIEVFVLPGHMLPGITGISLVILGILMTFVGREPPGMPGTWPRLPMTRFALESALVWLTGTMALSLVTMAALSRMLPKTPFMRRLILNATSGGTTLDNRNAPSILPTWPAVGAIGTAVTELRPGGMAAFHDPVLGDVRQIDVLSDTGYIPAGAKIVARTVVADHITVRQA